MTQQTWPKWEDLELLLTATYLREVRPGLFVGSELAVRVHEPWTARVDLTYEGILPHIDNPHPCMHIARTDGEAYSPDELDQVLRFVQCHLEVPDARVLIHCSAGISRSASVAFSMLAALDGLDHSEARRRVLDKLYTPSPNTFASVWRWCRARGMSV